MSISMTELARAREIVGGLLDELRLDAYVFEVEPGDDGWDVRVECAVAEGWETCRLRAPKASLLGAADEAAARRRLLDDWAEVLSACLRNV
jgi:hypothetical protein